MITTFATKSFGCRGRGSLKFEGDQLGRGKGEKSDEKTRTTAKKVMSWGFPGRWGQNNLNDAISKQRLFKRTENILSKLQLVIK